MNITTTNIVQLFEEELQRLLRKKKQEDRKQKAREILRYVNQSIAETVCMQTLGLN